MEIEKLELFRSKTVEWRTGCAVSLLVEDKSMIWTIGDEKRFWTDRENFEIE